MYVCSYMYILFISLIVSQPFKHVRVFGNVFVFDNILVSSTACLCVCVSSYWWCLRHHHHHHLCAGSRCVAALAAKMLLFIFTNILVSRKHALRARSRPWVRKHFRHCKHVRVRMLLFARMLDISINYSPRVASTLPP